VEAMKQQTDKLHEKRSVPRSAAGHHDEVDVPAELTSKLRRAIEEAEVERQKVSIFCISAMKFSDYFFQNSGEKFIQKYIMNVCNNYKKYGDLKPQKAIKFY
jgi:hypothetical protein